MPDDPKPQTTPAPSPTDAPQTPPTPQADPPKTPETTTPSSTTTRQPSLLNQEEPKVEPKAKEEPKADAKKETPSGAPEKYDDFKLPDGWEWDKEALGQTTALFKELNLSQEAAQKLVDFYNKQTQASSDTPVKHWEEMQEKWTAEIKADKDIGSKLPQVRESIGKAIDILGPELGKEFRFAMDLTGAGNNPAFVKAFYKFATLLTEGGHVSGKGPSKHGQTPSGQAGPPSAAAALYPNLPSARGGS